jgi:hypothetical protein
MSLEAAILELTEAVKANTAITEIFVAKAKAAVGAADAGEPAKRTRKTKETTAETGGDDDGVDVAKLKADIKAWMYEFKADEDDPETEARGTAFETALAKLGAKKLDEVKAEDLPRVVSWLEKKVAAGRATEKPSKKAAASEDDDDL